jgi:hypothetical protein
VLSGEGAMGQRMARSVVVFVALLLVGLAPSFSMAADPREIDVAIFKAKKYLYEQQNGGIWEREFDKHGDQKTGQTALVVHALLSAGESYKDDRLQQAIEYLKKTPTTGVYALSMRCQVWGDLPQTADVRTTMAKDARALINGIDRDPKGGTVGFYPYNLGEKNYSLSRAHYAVLGVWAAAQAGLEVPNTYWQFVEKSWVEQQDSSGGWSYYGAKSKNPNASNYAVTPGMTADGIATLFITQDYLHADEAITPRGNIKSPYIDKAMKWLIDNFKMVAEDKKFARDYPHATLFAIERVGAASGLKYFNDIDWYDIGAERFLRNQRQNGSWGGDGGGFDVAGTSMALIFLARGRAPVAISKLSYDIEPSNAEGNWNQRPRDVPNITRWISRQLERPFNWQIVNLKAPVAELHDAPILFIAGNQELKFGAEEKSKLRQFVEGGGLIVGNADANSPIFAKSYKQLGKELFPDYEFRQLPTNHPIFVNEQYPAEKWKRKPTVLAVSNGARELMLILQDTDLSRAWQLHETASRAELFEFTANLFLYAVDKKQARNKGETYQVTPDPRISPSQQLVVARIKYGGIWDPEPGGWRRMTAILNNRDRVGLKLLTVEPAKDSFGAARVAYLTGIGKFKLSDEARAAIKKFVQGGGLLAVEAAGGNSEFAQVAEAELSAIFGADAAAQLKNPLPPDAPIYRVGGRKLEDVGYRDFARQNIVGELKGPRLRGITVDGRTAVIYSPEDLSVGLVGEPVDGIIGYDPKTATAIVRNILLSVTSGGQAPSPPSTKPSSTTKKAK